ncbi:MAG: DUF262 domain-containing protein [Verrucomicrobiota bacterium]|jgi:hypothetical protein|nr:DUF262 domain-containing protein [Verrucomicrobiota bacterium]MDD8052321.1 DUF262 domain-containing protein [Verrucomicrobiota bacterium]MDI9382743.1 DUF262 domain-containing protein [Verrucomicrobiota bacterium]
MNTVECKLEDLFGDPCQYVVPSFQRPFSWSDDRHEVFLSGVLDSFSSDSPHRIFLGAIVIMPIEHSNPTLQKYLIVDGQQRLITMLALFAAIRDLTSIRYPEQALMLERTFLFNEGQAGSYRFKLLPHPKNRARFFQTLQHGVRTNPEPFPATLFFLTRLEQELDLDLRAFCAFLIRRFVAVRVEITKDENPYPIFKSLNMLESGVGPYPRGIDPRFAEDPELMAMIAGGESDNLEFKEGLTCRSTDRRHPERCGFHVARTVAAFMNSDNGGTLLLGVRDDGTIRGINREYRLIDRSKRNWDGYLLFLRNLLRSKLEADNPFQFYEIQHHVVSGREVCSIRVFPAEYPVYLDKRLYVRSGNQTLEMRGPDLVSYVKKRWPGKE